MIKISILQILPTHPALLFCAAKVHFFPPYSNIFFAFSRRSPLPTTCCGLNAFLVLPSFRPAFAPKKRRQGEGTAKKRRKKGGPAHTLPMRPRQQAVKPRPSGCGSEICRAIGGDADGAPALKSGANPRLGLVNRV